jgi:RNA polymerase sigma-70 factor (ECF subfamily)
MEIASFLTFYYGPAIGALARFTVKSPPMAAEIDQLAARALAGDAIAWRDLYDAMTPRVYALARRMGASIEDSAEIAQETWLRVLKNHEKYDRLRAFEPFLFTVAARLCVDLFRKRKTSPAAGAISEDAQGRDEPALEILFAAERSERIVHCMETLTDEERQIVRLRYWDDLSNREVGDRLGATPTSIKGKSYRAVRKLADCMQLEQYSDFSPPTASAESPGS